MIDISPKRPVNSLNHFRLENWNSKIKVFKTSKKKKNNSNKDKQRSFFDELLDLLGEQ